MDKKGMDERQILWIFYFVVLVIIVLAAITYVKNQASKTGLDEEYYARDLAYLLDTIAYANGDLEFRYKIDDGSFDFFVGNVDGMNKIVVAKELNSNGYGAGSKSYSYNLKEEFGIFEKPSILVITKKEGIIEIHG